MQGEKDFNLQRNCSKLKHLSKLWRRKVGWMPPQHCQKLFDCYDKLEITYILPGDTLKTRQKIFWRGEGPVTRTFFTITKPSFVGIPSALSK